MFLLERNKNIEEPKKRDLTIDCLKGILIVAVVLGHVASGFHMSLDKNIIYLMCYSWHMFLFIAVSGYLVGISKKTIDLHWLWKRAKRLIIPLSSWTIIVMFIDGDVSLLSYVYYMICEPVYWYLLVQFIFEAIYVFTKYIRYPVIGVLGCAISCIVLYLLFRNIDTLRQLLLYYPFYWAGVFVGKNKKIFTQKLKRIIWLSLFLYPVSMLFYSWKDYTRVSEILTLIFSNMHIPENIINNALRFLNMGGYRVYNHYVVSPLGCLFYICIAVIICNTSFLRIVKRIFCYLGEKTIYIYILHMYFVSMIDNTEGIYALLRLVLGIIIPCIVSEIVKRNSFIDAVLFGGDFKFKQRNRKRYISKNNIST